MSATKALRTVDLQCEQSSEHWHRLHHDPNLLIWKWVRALASPEQVPSCGDRKERVGTS